MGAEPAPGRQRKPYRISKPRERWTEAEHERFVQAINQHGRNWKRIVQEVGTRTVAQVRSHAQKYFLKLEKAGATEEVPPARAKRPSAKPYPSAKGAGESSRSSQSAAPPERKKLRRTERTSTRPVRQDFHTFLDKDTPPQSADGNTSDSIALLQGADAAEGKNSNGSGQSSARETSALSTADLDYANCLGMPSQPDLGRFLQDATVMQPVGERSDPTDASSGAVAGGAVGSATDTPNYGELYDVVGKLYTHPAGASHEHLMQQLGASQREELAHMLDQLTGEMRESVHDGGASGPGQQQQQQPPASQQPTPLGQGMFELSGSMPLLPEPGGARAMAGLDSRDLDGGRELGVGLSGSGGGGGYGSSSGAYGGSSGGGGSYGGLPPAVPPDVPMDPAQQQGTDLLPSCAQPAEQEAVTLDFDGGDWRLSGDLKSLLAPEPEYSALPQLIDTKGMFDY